MKTFFCLCAFALSLSLFAQQQVVQTESTIHPQQTKRTLKRKVAIARFSNETAYGKGIFYNKDNDPLKKQAIDILSAKLAASNKFILLERSDLDKIIDEQKSSNTDSSFSKTGADFIIIGSLTEFGRKNIGENNVFSKTKTQVVQAGVSIRLVDVSTSQIIYSEEAKGEAELATKTVLGFGKDADFDASLSDKAISAAMSKLVENIINNCMDKPWKAFFLNADENGILISGGKSQGLQSGDILEVFEKGKTIKNPQTGLNLDLPSKFLGKIKIESLLGDSPQNEVSLVSFVNTPFSINKNDLSKYIIKEPSYKD